jgi:hypothetical protein
LYDAEVVAARATARRTSDCMVEQVRGDSKATERGAENHDMSMSRMLDAWRGTVLRSTTVATGGGARSQTSLSWRGMHHALDSTLHPGTLQHHHPLSRSYLKAIFTFHALLTLG